MYGAPHCTIFLHLLSSSLLGPKIHPSILFSNTLNLCCAPILRDRFILFENKILYDVKLIYINYFFIFVVG